MKPILVLALACIFSCNTKMEYAPQQPTNVNFYRQIMDSSVLKLASIKEIDNYNLTISAGKRGYLYIHFKSGGDTTWDNLNSQDVSALGVILKEKFIAYNIQRKEIFGVSELKSSSQVAFTK